MDRQRRGFTLIEVLVTIVLVTLAVVGVLGGIRSLTVADVRAREADLLQRLASQKLNEMGSVTDPMTAETSGDFTDEGYGDVTWEMTVEPSGTTDLEIVKVTATRGDKSQELTALIYVRPTTGAAGGTTP